MDLLALSNSIKYQHSRKVSEISGILADLAGYSPSDRSIIEQAALFHDIGKEEIPEHILNKRGPLTPAEFDIVKRHTGIGYAKLCEAAKTLDIAAVVAREHHEKLDGSGYIGLTGDLINPFVKLIAVADVFDALSSKRPYKEAWCRNDIEAYFLAQAGKQFDPAAVALLLGAVDLILALYDNA